MYLDIQLLVCKSSLHNSPGDGEHQLNPKYKLRLIKEIVHITILSKWPGDPAFSFGTAL